MTRPARAVAAAALFVLFAALAAQAVASTSTTVKPGDYVLRNQDNTIPPGYTATTSRFKTPEECKAAAAALGDTRKCDHSDLITTVSTCTDEKAPKVYLSKVTNPEDGKVYWEIPGASWVLAPGSDVDYIEVADLLVHNAAWPAGYPNCWVPGRAPRSEWRKNSKDEPGKVFMEHLEPGMPVADLEEELPNSVEPVATMPEFEEMWLSPESQAARLAHYDCHPETDTLPCPALPKFTSACGPYWSVECAEGPGVDPGAGG